MTRELKSALDEHFDNITGMIEDLVADNESCESALDQANKEIEELQDRVRELEEELSNKE